MIYKVEKFSKRRLLLENKVTDFGEDVYNLTIKRGSTQRTFKNIEIRDFKISNEQKKDIVVSFKIIDLCFGVDFNIIDSVISFDENNGINSLIVDLTMENNCKRIHLFNTTLSGCDYSYVCLTHSINAALKLEFS